MSDAAVQERSETMIFDREAIEDFLYEEAAILDKWQLEEWQKLFTPDGRYEITPLGFRNPEELDPAKILFLVADDSKRLTQRTIRLLKKTAHAEYPRSRTRHLISNTRIRRDGDEILTSSCFVVYRVRREEVMTYMGMVNHVLRPVDGKLKIALKRACLDLDTLKPQGTVSIIL